LSELVRLKAPPAIVEGAAAAQIDAHPADYELYVLAAQSLSAEPGQASRTLAWVNRALFLRPTHGEAHRSAARALLRLGRRSQALLEYRLARTSDARVEGVRVARTVDELDRLVDTPQDRLDVAGDLRRAGRFAEAEGLVAKALEDPSSAAPVDLWVEGAALAGLRRDFDTARARLEGAARVAPGSPAVAHAQAELLMAEGRREDAVPLLQSLAIKEPQEPMHALTLARLFIDLGRPREARDALVRLSPFVSSPSVRAQMMIVEAQAFESQRSWAKAVSSYQSASRLAPAWPSPHFSAATLYERLGKFDEARSEIYAGVRASGAPITPENRDWIARLEKAAAMRQLTAPQEAEP
jgi:Flp pilus assembly protein TadD